MSRRGRAFPRLGKCLPRVVSMQWRRIAWSPGSRRCSRPIRRIVTRMDTRTSPNPRLPLRRPCLRRGRRERAPDRVECGEPAVQPADPQDSYEDGSPHEPEPAPAAPPPVPAPVQAVATLPRRQGGGGKTPPPPPPPSGGDGDDEDDEGMLRMSFLGHLEELRTRIIRALM